MIRLLDKYGYSTPVFIDEIQSDGYTITDITSQGFKKFTDTRLKEDVFYYPRTFDFFGKTMEEPLSIEKVLEKRYVGSETRLYGFYTGFYGAYAIHATTQIPMIKQIKSQKTDTTEYYDMISYQYIVLPFDKRVESEDIKYHQLLDVLSTSRKFFEPEIDIKEVIKDYIKSADLSTDKLKEISYEYDKLTQEEVIHALT